MHLFVFVPQHLVLLCLGLHALSKEEQIITMIKIIPQPNDDHDDQLITQHTHTQQFNPESNRKKS